MKELIKIEALRLKMPPKLRPKVHEIRTMLFGVKGAVNDKQIERMIEILNTTHTKNIEWLESMKSK